MMSAPQPLFDEAALRQHRRRAGTIDAQQWFLHDRAIDQLQERLADVNRTFTKPAIIGPRANQWAKALNLSAVCVSDDPVLALEPGAHDLVIHALALHWANDPVGQLIQMCRALRPDGLMIAVLFAGDTLHELRAALSQAEARVRGGLAPRIAPMADVRALGSLLQRAGFALPVADVETARVSYDSPLALMRDLRAMGETNAILARDKRPLPRAVLNRLDDIYPCTDGRIEATFELAFLTGWAPAESQPRPLRPGSAKMRLADALGVPELPAGAPTTDGDT